MGFSFGKIAEAPALITPSFIPENRSLHAGMDPRYRTPETMTEQHTENIRRKKRRAPHTDQRKTHQNTLTRTNRAASFGTLSCSLNHRNRQPTTEHRKNHKQPPLTGNHKTQIRQYRENHTTNHQKHTKNTKTRYAQNTVFYNNKQFRRRKKGGCSVE